MSVLGSLVALCISLTTPTGTESGAGAVPGAEGPWTLRDCLTYALDHSPHLVAEGKRVGIAERQVDVAAAARKPQTSLQGSAAVQGPPVVVQFSPDSPPITLMPAMQGSLSLQVALPLDISRRLHHLEESAEYAASAAHERYRQATQQLLLDVISAYYSVLEARTAIEAAGAGRVRAAAELTVTRARAEAGTVTARTLTAAESAVARARESEAQAEQALATARSRLASVMGLPADGSPDLAAEPLALSTDLPWEQARGVACSERPELAALAWTARSLGATAEAVRAGTKPSLALASAAQLGTPSALQAPASWRIGLAFTWPISDGGSARAQRASAELNREATLEDLQATRLQVESQVYAAIAALYALRETALSDDAQVADAERRLAEVSAALDAGTARRSDLTGAEAALTIARAGRERHAHETSVARAEWGRALGILDKLLLAPTGATTTGDDRAPEPSPPAPLPGERGARAERGRGEGGSSSPGVEGASLVSPPKLLVPDRPAGADGTPDSAPRSGSTSEEAGR